MAGNNRRAGKLQLTVLKPDGQVRGPELPDGPSVLPDHGDWHPLVRRKWESLRKSPLAARWLDTDWCFALDTMIVYNSVLSSGRWEMFGELRMREQKLGATYADRIAMKFETPDANDNATVQAELAARQSFQAFQRRRMLLA